MYGSSRLGVWNPNRNVATLLAINYDAYSGNFVRGNKGFELSNHLGNVLVTVSDKKIQATDCPPCTKPPCPLCVSLIDYYLPDVISANDYYPGGMQMPGRKYQASSASTYRYGFNGKENDNEVKGEGNQQDYGMRIYDPRLGKFLSVDPIANKYPELTPYQFASNTPIQAIDLDGLEAFFIHGTTSSPDLRWIKVRNSDGTAKEYFKNVAAIMGLTDNKTKNATFEWKNDGLLNSQKDRRSAAQRLADHVMNNLVGGEDITLIGHSHGGNIAIQASGIIRAKLDANDATKNIKINVITISTPAYNGADDNENPSNQPIDNHLHIYNTRDFVQTTLANVANTVAPGVPSKTATRTYDNPNTVNYKISVSTEYGLNSTDAHSFDFLHPQFLNNDINAGTLRKVTDQSAPKQGSSPKSYDPAKYEF